MVNIILTKDYKIGSYFYREFDTYNHDPSTLHRILQRLPDTELEAKKLLCEAICYGHYKKNKTMTYLIPPVRIDGELVTHIDIKKTPTDLLRLIMFIYNREDVKNKVTITINNTIKMREEQEKDVNRKRYEDAVIIVTLPIKKRKFV